MRFMVICEGGKSILEGEGKELSFGYPGLVMPVERSSEKDVGLMPRRLVLAREIERNRERDLQGHQIINFDQGHGHR